MSAGISTDMPVSGRDAAAAPDGAIHVEARGPVLLIGLNRPEKYNGLTPAMFSALADAYTRLDEDPALRCGVLFAFGKHFTAGLELTRFAEGMKKGASGADGAGAARVDPFGLERKCAKPLVSAVQGICYTAGIELMLATDIAVAAVDTRFAQLEPRRGLMAAGGGTVRFIQRCGSGNGMYHLLLCDEEFGAAEAYRIGLVQEVVEPGAQVPRAITLAARIAALAPLAIQETKRSVQTYLEAGEAAAFAALGAAQARLANTEDAAEGVRSFIERRTAKFKGR